MPAGVHVQPSPDQLRRRKHAMQHVRDDVYMTTDSTNWKTGELVLTDWQIDKSMVNHVSVTDDDEAEPEAVTVRDIGALKALKVADLLPMIPELSTAELDELADIDNRVSVQEAIDDARANLPVVSKFGAVDE
jgi:hypothetical protein